MESDGRYVSAKLFLENLRKLHKLNPEDLYLGYPVKDLEERFEKIPLNVLMPFVKSKYGLFALNFILIKTLVKPS